MPEMGLRWMADKPALRYERKRGHLVLLSLLLFLFIVGGYELHSADDNGRDLPVTIWVPEQPYSFDPIEFDSAIHHVTARPCIASLVTQYRDGGFVGIIAESWHNNPEFTEWHFKVRPGLHFSNGDQITAQHVGRSLVRMAWLQHQRSSRSGLTEHLLGIERITSAADDIPGIKVSDGEVILSFKDSQPKLLEAISFGLYSIVHPNDYDLKSGAWKNPTGVIASGPYVPEEWTLKHVMLKLRDNFPESLRHPEAPASYEVIWSKGRAGTALLSMGSDTESAEHKGSDFHASGSTDIAIRYVRVMSWSSVESPLHDLSLRRCLRSSFYKSLESLGVRASTSFLPTSIPGVAEADDYDHAANSSHPFKIKVVNAADKTTISGKMSTAIAEAVVKCGGEVVYVQMPDSKSLRQLSDANLGNYALDIHPKMTGLLVEDPISDVRFMIESKEGIRLPDPTGRLHAEAASKEPNLGKINRIIWDDAAAWPVMHFIDGLWARKGLFDFSMLNLDLPPTDLSWIGFSK